DGLAPPSQADLLREAVLNGSRATEYDAALDTCAARRRTH
ncbi:MAG TPA: phytanoyl-CoA dioxygenase, partial [Acidimicrobiaceae bacterium]|nr:phytanoyl-CoA dioxygenase [Acidimicrobiaceae bacterium]